MCRFPYFHLSILTLSLVHTLFHLVYLPTVWSLRRSTASSTTHRCSPRPAFQTHCPQHDDAAHQPTRPSLPLRFLLASSINPPLAVVAPLAPLFIYWTGGQVPALAASRALLPSPRPIELGSLSSYYRQAFQRLAPTANQTSPPLTCDAELIHLSLYPPRMHID
jgi:hypothetical protein